MVVSSPIRYYQLQPGKLYKADATKGDIIVGIDANGFSKKASLYANLPNSLHYVPLYDVMMFVAKKNGFTERYGWGINWLFIHKSKFVYFSKENIVSYLFFPCL